MKTDRNGFIDSGVAVVALAGVIIIAGLAFGLPQYGVWTKTLSGKAQLQEAEYTRQVAVLEAQAKKDSAQQLAEAEIIRAGGVAKANQIIGDSLKDNREYLQYLYITGIEDGSKNGNVTIYVPTEGGMPVPTLQMNK
jgi:regulator of protease activity HflC (stomatin/prohibitin superfamily)